MYLLTILNIRLITTLKGSYFPRIAQTLPDTRLQTIFGKLATACQILWIQVTVLIQNRLTFFLITFKILIVERITFHSCVISATI